MKRWFRLSGWRLPLHVKQDELPELLAGALGLGRAAILDWRLTRQSVDARREVCFVYAVEFAVEEGLGEKLRARRPDLVVVPDVLPINRMPGTEPLTKRPVVVGFGPAGIFAALYLAEKGYAPLILERGKPLAERVLDVEGFWRGGVLNPESNVQYGAGGAGTFSDGKLQSRGKDPRQAEVFARLIAAGAPAEIAYRQGAHLGTDRLRAIVARLQEQAEAAGAEVRYGARVTQVLREGGRLRGLRLADGSEIPLEVCLLCPGHSARDTFAMLHEAGVTLAAKAFAVGVRIEHSQETIDRRQYKGFAGHPALGAAEYRLVWQDPVSGRGVYTFCMCPGGQVIAAASETGGVVTNGMSYADRGGATANSAVVVTVGPADFGGEDPLAGIAWQRRLERAAFQAGGGTYHAPCQLVGDFLAGRPSAAEPEPKPTYRPGVAMGDLRACLPECVTGPIARALPVFDRMLPGFAGPRVPLTGVETRTSSPVRIVRGPDLTAPGWEGLYPAGEGAGYAGGIVSAAVDGLRAAEAAVSRYARPRGG